MTRQKIGILFLWFLYALALPAAPLYVRVDIQAKFGTLKSADGILRPAGWLGDKKESILVGSVSSSDGETWKRYSFSFIPSESGEVVLYLRGPFSRSAPQWVMYRNLRWNGRPLPNGDFSNGLTGWRIRKPASGMSAALVEDPALVPAGRAARVWHDGCLSRVLPVRKGEKTTVEFEACPTMAFTPVSGGLPLSLRAFVNRAYADETAGDGRGGWSDQGAEKDLRKFDPSQKQFRGVGFELVEPKPGAPEAVVVFDSSRAPTGVREISLDVPAESKQYRFLYLLHSGCWIPGETTEIGSVIFEDREGRRYEQKLLSGRDLQDWSRKVWTANALPVSRGKYSGEFRMVYLSKFVVPAKNIRKILLKTTGRAVWIVCGVTLTNFEVGLSDKPFTPGDGYKKADLAPTPFTQPGSALDFSAMEDHKPAGKFGNARLAGQGTLEFEKRPGTPLRFRAAYHFASEWSFMASVRKRRKSEELKPLIDDYVAELKRRNYNMVRTHTIEQLLMLDAPEYGRPDPRFADAVDYLFAQLRKNGIYLNLNLVAYQMLYPFRLTSASRPLDLKTKMIFGDEKVRQAWLETAKYFLCRRNPYTGIALKDDPFLVCVEPYNELGLGIRLHNWKEKKTVEWLREKFRAFVLRRNGHVDESRFPSLQELGRSSAMHREWVEFCILAQQETGKWMNDRLRELGYRRLIGQYNVSPQRYYGDIRSEQSDIVIRNSYFCHPSSLATNRSGAVTQQLSAIELFVPYFTNAATSRLADRPIFITEYNHARTCYEYEQMLFPAYAALQGFSALTMHAVDMRRVWEADKAFSTYLDRMTEILSMFLFQRGYVSPSKHLVELEVPAKSLFDAQTDSAVSADQATWALLTRFALKYAGTSQPPLVAALPTEKPLFTMKLAGYADVRSGGQFMETDSVRGRKFDPVPLIAKLRSKGIISRENRTNAADGIWQSDTDELFLNGPQKLFTLQTPKAEAVVSEGFHNESLKVLKAVQSSVPSTVALVSLDGKELAANSRRMLLFYLTDSLNHGMVLSPDRSTTLKHGRLPILLRTGKLELRLGLTGGRFTLYPLRSDGMRRKGIPLEGSAGNYHLQLDTATLPDGVTGVFELVAESR